MSIVALVLTVLAVALTAAYVVWTAVEVYRHPRVIMFRRAIQEARHPTSDATVIARLEHELEIAGHEADCQECVRRRYASGGPILSPGEFVIPPRMVAQYGPLVRARNEAVREQARECQCHGPLGDDEMWRTMQCPHDV